MYRRPINNLKSTLFDDAVAIGKEELFEVFHLLLELLANVGVPDQHAMSGEVEQLYLRMDIYTACHRFAQVVEVFMLNELHTMTIVDERVSCNAGLDLIRLGEAAVYHESESIGADR